MIAASEKNECLTKKTASIFQKNSNVYKLLFKSVHFNRKGVFSTIFTQGEYGMLFFKKRFCQRQIIFSKITIACLSRKSVMDFNFFSPQQLWFGAGNILKLPKAAFKYGQNVLLITGTSAFKSSTVFEELVQKFDRESIRVSMETISSEPGPDQIDRISEKYRMNLPDVVVAVGGGSVTDGGKAVSAMLTKAEPVQRYLEGVGDLAHDGKKIPFIACPTTAGTGSEATKNAVITKVGKNGFKKSLRHDRFVPDVAIVDPALTCSCPFEISAACGMDALTQLIESFVSVKATPMTDALASGALKTLGNALVKVADNPQDIEIRSRISYAAYISGLTLANAGLGLVHGFAGRIGGLKPIAHGVVCGTLLARTTRSNVEELARLSATHPGIKKYAQAAKCLDPATTETDELKGAWHLCDLLDSWRDNLSMPPLRNFNVTQKDIETITALSSLKNNPCDLAPETMKQILSDCL